MITDKRRTVLGFGQHEFCISKFFVQGVYLLLIMILIIRSVLIDGQNYSGIHAY